MIKPISSQTDSMHEFDFTFDFRNWTDEHLERLIDLLEEAGEYDKARLLVNYLHPAKEEIVTIVDLDGTSRTYTQMVRA